MIERRTGSVLEAAAEVEALVNTVNCKGVMGKGIALLMKKAYPENYTKYREECEAGTVQIGRMLTVLLERQLSMLDSGSGSGPRAIINFPTKKHWRHPSKLSYIEQGLPALVGEVQKIGLTSIAIPALGCGNGGLDWDVVRPLIEAAFAPVDNVTVYLYEPYTGDAAPGHAEPEATELSEGEAALVQVAAAYQTQGYRLSGREVDLLGRLLAYADQHTPTTAGIGAPLPWWLVATETDGEPALAVAHDAAEAAERRLPGTVAGPTAARVTRLIEGWETPYSLELLVTVHDLVCANPGLSDAQIQAADDWRAPMRGLLRGAHIAKARAQLERFGLLAPAATNQRRAAS